MATNSVPNVQLLFGPMLIGTFLNAILFGILCMQTLTYFQIYHKRDTRWLQLFVSYLFALETINTACDIGMMYEPLVLKFGTTAATTFFPHLLAAEPIITVAISTPIQIFIAYRVRVLSQTRWIASIICVLAAIAAAGGIYTTTSVTLIRRFARKPELHWPALIWLVASAACDVIITSGLVWVLARRKTGFVTTDGTIDKIIRLTLQTGLITTILAILDVVSFITLPHTTLNFLWDFALPKLYAVTLMSTLNARAGWDMGAMGHTLSPNQMRGSRTKHVGHNVLFGQPYNRDCENVEAGIEFSTINTLRLGSNLRSGSSGWHDAGLDVTHDDELGEEPYSAGVQAGTDVSEPQKVRGLVVDNEQRRYGLDDEAPSQNQSKTSVPDHKADDKSESKEGVLPTLASM